MGASPVAGLQVVAAWPCISSPQRTFVSRATASKFNLKVASQGLTKLSNISLQGLPERYPSSSSKYHRIVPRAMTGESEEGTAYGLPIDLRGVALLDLRNYPFIFGAYFVCLQQFMLSIL